MYARALPTPPVATSDDIGSPHRALAARRAPEDPASAFAGSRQPPRDALAATLARSVDRRSGAAAPTAIVHRCGCGCEACAGRLATPSSAGSVALLQRNCTECGRKKGHTQECSRRPPSTKKAKQQKQQSAAARSLANLRVYKPGWVTANDITEASVRDFLRTYTSVSKMIRGHGSGGTDDGTQQNTEDDCKAYKTWHTRTYGWR